MTHTLEPKTWIDNYADYLYNFAMYRVKNSALAEDLVQDSFVSAFKARESFRGTASEKTWLTTILRNKIIDYYRKSSTKMQVNISALGDAADYFFDTNEDEGSGAWRANAAPQSFQSGKLDPAEQSELADIIKDCFSKLPANWNKISSMKLLEEMETEEICEINQISKSNFWVIIHRAKLQLRNCLQINWKDQ